MSSPTGQQLVSPNDILKQVAAAVPEDFRKNIIIVGSLAAGYHFFGDDPRLQVRTKDVDCLLSPRIQGIPAARSAPPSPRSSTTLMPTINHQRSTSV